MIRTLTRLRRIRSLLHRWSGQPYLRGRAMQVGGGALLADGLVGLENPLDGRRSRAGILGSIFVVVILAVLLFALGLAKHSTEPYPGGATVQGTITSVDETSSSSGSNSGGSADTCSATVAYTVDGARYEASTTSSSTSLCSARGDAVDVSYQPSDPASGRPQLRSDSIILTGATVLCWVFLVIAVLTVLVRAAEIVVGGWLVLRGRSTVRSAEPVPADRMLEEMQAAWEGSGTEVPGRG